MRQINRRNSRQRVNAIRVLLANSRSPHPTGAVSLIRRRTSPKVQFRQFDMERPRGTTCIDVAETRKQSPRAQKMAPGTYDPAFS